ncbi:ribonuclease Z [uncultured Dysosmobacter sp.]|uniref:ribonuclease Z n=1 Tax=uncultured Dysosmobacter sp. TaxID=2591384 RepID=UPI00262DC5DE|nr:ribonuclease Z [uncultured Dysosmobacter sp.]
MIVAVCIGEDGGMLFNRRRVSRDRAQRADLLALCGGKALRMNDYSAALFRDAADQIIVDKAFLETAGPGDVCFVEDRPLSPWMAEIEAVVLYRWNRAYPADVRLDLDLSAFERVRQTEFPGSSHERVTREIYRGKER